MMFIHLREEGLHRATDAEIVKKAIKERRAILTCDLDFGDLMASSGEICLSIIIFRLQNERPENVNRRLEQVLKESSDALQKRCNYKCGRSKAPCSSVTNLRDK